MSSDIDAVAARRNGLLREPLLDPETAAHLLGIPRSSIYEYARRGELPYVKIGRHLKFVRSDLERAIDERRIGR